jgi:hypothetical protein
MSLIYLKKETTITVLSQKLSSLAVHLVPLLLSVLLQTYHGVGLSFRNSMKQQNSCLTSGHNNAILQLFSWLPYESLFVSISSKECVDVKI